MPKFKQRVFNLILQLLDVHKQWPITLNAKLDFTAHLRSKHQDLLDFITNEDPKVKGDAEDKIKAALDEYAATFA